MNYQNNNTTERAQESPLWKDVERQDGKALPYLLERYLLLENWRYLDCHNRGEDHDYLYDIQYLHLLLSEATTVLLSQEERIRVLEKQVAGLLAVSNPLASLL